MSHLAAQQAIDRLHHNIIAIEPHSISRFQSNMQTLSATSIEDGKAEMARTRVELSAAYGGGSDNAESKPFAFANGLAVIPVHGSLINRFGYSYSNVTGYNFIRSQLRMALADPDVTGIIFDVNSNGGEVAGCFELCAEILAARAVKPSLAIGDSRVYSAAYAIGSSASRLVLTPSAGAGSIGVVSMHIDISQAMENFGVKMTLIHSGDHKVDGNPFEPLPDEVRAEIQTELDATRAIFVGHVAKARNLSEKAVHDTEARTYRADKAVQSGLVDEILTVDQAIQSFYSAISDAPTSENLQMTQQQTTTASAQTATADQTATVDAAAIRNQERARTQGILNCEEAKGRQELASHLAFNTEMSVADAQAILKVSPVKADSSAADTTNPLEKAMASQTGAVVDPDTGASNEDMSASDKVLADYAAATGRTFGAKK